MVTKIGGGTIRHPPATTEATPPFKRASKDASQAVPPSPALDGGNKRDSPAVSQLKSDIGQLKSQITSVQQLVKRYKTSNLAGDVNKKLGKYYTEMNNIREEMSLPYNQKFEENKVALLNKELTVKDNLVNDLKKIANANPQSKLGMAIDKALEGRVAYLQPQQPQRNPFVVGGGRPLR